MKLEETVKNKAMIIDESKTKVTKEEKRPGNTRPRNKTENRILGICSEAAPFLSRN